MAHGRVLFFSAPRGWTVLADHCCAVGTCCGKSAADPDCVIPPSAQDWDILLIDDLQLMQGGSRAAGLCELIRSSPERRFVYSTGVWLPDGVLVHGLMTVLETGRPAF